MTDFNIEKIIPECEKFGVVLDEQAVERLNIFGSLLLSWNEKINLTAITDPTEVLYKHFFDSLLFFKNVDVPKGASIIDVGTGAGFPGIVLKITREDINLTLLDGLDKRLKFLDAVLKETGLSANLVHGRAEEIARKPEYRESFDFATARAVANLPVLCEFCIPFIKNGGMFVALKGENGKAEAEAAQNAYKILGCLAPEIYDETLTGNEKRTIIVAEKIKDIAPKYPRNYGKIKKSPL